MRDDEGDPIICPQCGSENVVQTPEGKNTWKCLACNFSWNEDKIHNMPEEEDWSSEENCEEEEEYEDPDSDLNEEEDGAFVL